MSATGGCSAQPGPGQPKRPESVEAEFGDLGGLSRLRVRAHIEATSPLGERPAGKYRPRSGDPALLVHVLADEREQSVAAVTFEVLLTSEGAVPIRERWFAPAERRRAVQAAIEGRLPDVLPGLAAAAIHVEDIGELGRSVCNRGYSRERQPRWPISGWDQKWQMGRLAVHTGRARAQRRAVGGGPARRSDGFSIVLAGCLGETVSENGHSYRREDFYPRLTAKATGPGHQGAFLGWVPPRRSAGQYRGAKPAMFVDLQLLAGALTGGDIDDPAQVCHLFGVDWPGDVSDPVRCLRAQARALVDLYGRLVWALDAAAPGLSPAKAWSFGSLTTHALRTAKVQPPLSKCARVPVADLAAAASACHGGLFQALLVGIVEPAVQVDVTAAYATMFSLLDLGWVYSCRSIRSARVDLRRLRQVLSDPDRLWNPQTWRELGLTFVTVRPRGQVLPAHLSHHGRDGGLRVGPLDLGGGELTFHWTDLAAAVIYGADPGGFDIVRAFRLVGTGLQKGRRPLRMPSGRLIDPDCPDLGRALVDEREQTRGAAELWLPGVTKGFSNAIAYGQLLRTDTINLSNPVETVAYGPSGERLVTRTRSPERPGPYTFIPAGAGVSGGIRLIMAMLTHAVRARGSQVAALHCDSAVILCSTGGGWTTGLTPAVRVLAETELATILGRFTALGVSFKTEIPPQIDGRPVSALVVGRNKVIFARTGPDGEITVVRSSDTGLGGHLAAPSDSPGRRLSDGRWAWTACCQSAILGAAASVPADPARPLDLGDQPTWVDRPALRRHRAPTWPALAQLREQMADPTIGPFARYPRATQSGTDSGPVALGAHPDARTWHTADWRLHGAPVGLDVPDEHDGVRVFSGRGAGRRMLVERVRDHLHRWVDTFDPSMTGPVRGLRQPAATYSAAGLVDVVGRDGPELMAGDEDPTTVDAATHRLTYGTTADQALRDRVRAAGVRRVARATGIPASTLGSWLRGGHTSPSTLGRLSRALDDLEVHGQPTARQCARDGCAQPARRRGRWCSDRCRMAAARSKHPTDPPAPATATGPALPARHTPRAAATASARDPKIPRNPRKGGWRDANHT